MSISVFKNMADRWHGAYNAWVYSMPWRRRSLRVLLANGNLYAGGCVAVCKCLNTGDLLQCARAKSIAWARGSIRSTERLFTEEAGLTTGSCFHWLDWLRTVIVLLPEHPDRECSRSALGFSSKTVHLRLAGRTALSCVIW